MKRLLALTLCLALLCPAALAAEGEEPWRRTEPGGHYVTIRVPCPEGVRLDWGDRRMLCLRYADTKEPVPLSSDLILGMRSMLRCLRLTRPGPWRFSWERSTGSQTALRSGRATPTIIPPAVRRNSICGECSRGTGPAT